MYKHLIILIVVSFCKIHAQVVNTWTEVIDIPNDVGFVPSVMSLSTELDDLLLSVGSFNVELNANIYSLNTFGDRFWTANINTSGVHNDIVRDIVVKGNQSYILLNTSIVVEGQIGGESSVLNYSDEGDLVWEYDYSLPGRFTYLNKLLSDSNSLYLFGSNTDSINNSDRSTSLAELNNNGSLQWSITIDNSLAVDVEILDELLLVLCLNAEGKLTFTQINRNTGLISSENVIENLPFSFLSIPQVQIDALNNVIYIMDPHEIYKVYRLDLNGEIEWTFELDSQSETVSSLEKIVKIVPGNNGRVYIGGNLNKDGCGINTVLSCLNENGENVWESQQICDIDFEYFMNDFQVGGNYFSYIGGELYQGNGRIVVGDLATGLLIYDSTLVKNVDIVENLDNLILSSNDIYVGGKNIDGNNSKYTIRKFNVDFVSNVSLNEIVSKKAYLYPTLYSKGVFFKSSFYEPIKLEVYDFSGRKIISKVCEDLDFIYMPRGQFFYRVINENEVIYSSILISK